MTEPNPQSIEEYRQHRVQETARILQQVAGDPDPAIETLHDGAKQVAIEKSGPVEFMVDHTLERGSLAPAPEDRVKHVEHVDPVAKMAADRQGDRGTTTTAPEVKGTADEDTATKF
ncbi:hypothetical protein AC578_1265 [Pseudocercospora eumusae]|uniref:Uncharacterized protein n=1 Tax=Pseudocercospora eumusae TaxID=321146 RepID=A0A139H8F3_9PEZI|nr:hypothetical protein AC578_1265 [Pseudocercospora eumusae]